MKNNILTGAVSVGEFDAVDVQSRSQVDRPPRVCRWIGHCTGTVQHVGTVLAVVSVGGMINTIIIGERTHLIRRTTFSDVHIEASIHRHCTTHYYVTASTVYHRTIGNCTVISPAHDTPSRPILAEIFRFQNTSSPADPDDDVLPLSLIHIWRCRRRG